MEERFSESKRSSASKGKSSSEGEADDEDAGEESSQMSLLTLQELEEPLASVFAGAEPATSETRYGAQEELKTAKDTGTEDMEVAMSEVASTVGDLMPMSSQDAVIIHISEERGEEH